VGTEWATPENELPYTPHIHIGGTVTKKRNGKVFTEFWMSRPRPEGVSIDEWEELEEAKWKRIFGKENA